MGFNEIELFKFIKKRFVSKNIEVKDIVLKIILSISGYLDSSREKIFMTWEISK